MPFKAAAWLVSPLLLSHFDAIPTMESSAEDWPLSLAGSPALFLSTTRGRGGRRLITILLITALRGWNGMIGRTCWYAFEE